MKKRQQASPADMSSQEKKGIYDYSFTHTQISSTIIRSENGAKFHFEFQKIQFNTNMFESVSFLTSSLPRYFNSLLSQLVKSQHKFDPRLTLLVGDFIKMSKTIFMQTGVGSEISDFVYQCFLLQHNQDQHKNAKDLKIQNQRKFIELKFGEVNYLGIRVLLLLLSVDFLLCDTNSISLDQSDPKVLKLQQQILNSMKKLRFYLETEGYCNGDSLDNTQKIYQKFIEVVVDFLIDTWKISKQTYQIYQDILKNDLANISDQLRRNLITKIKKQIFVRETPKISSHKPKKQNIFNKQTKKLQTEDYKTEDYQTADEVKIFSHKTKKSAPVSHKQAKDHHFMIQKHQTIKQNDKIQETVRIKHKPIAKTRTIHQSRTNMFVPKANLAESFSFLVGQNSYCQKYQRSTQNSIDFAQNNERKFMEIYNQADDDILVRSTPQLIRIPHTSGGIYKKLNFGDE